MGGVVAAAGGGDGCACGSSQARTATTSAIPPMIALTPAQPPHLSPGRLSHWSNPLMMLPRSRGNLAHRQRRRAGLAVATGSRSRSGAAHRFIGGIDRASRATAPVNSTVSATATGTMPVTTRLFGLTSFRPTFRSDCDQLLHEGASSAQARRALCIKPQTPSRSCSVARRSPSSSAPRSTPVRTPRACRLRPAGTTQRRTGR